MGREQGSCLTSYLARNSPTTTKNYPTENFNSAEVERQSHLRLAYSLAIHCYRIRQCSSTKPDFATPAPQSGKVQKLKKIVGQYTSHQHSRFFFFNITVFIIKYRVEWHSGYSHHCCDHHHHLVPECLSSVQSLSHVQLFATPWTAAHQASLSITSSWGLLKLMSIESVMPSSHLILCHLLLLPPSIFPSLRVFSNESVLCIRW